VGVLWTAGLLVTSGKSEVWEVTTRYSAAALERLAPSDGLSSEITLFISWYANQKKVLEGPIGKQLLIPLEMDEKYSGLRDWPITMQGKAKFLHQQDNPY